MQAAHHLGSPGDGSSETRSGTVALDSWAARQLECGDLTSSGPVLSGGLMPTRSRPDHSSRLHGYLEQACSTQSRYGAKHVEERRLFWQPQFRFYQYPILGLKLK
jgi:hypothetical protein